MTVKEFYEKHNSDYDGVMGRLLTEARVLKYLRKMEPQNDYGACMDSAAQEDWPTLFRASHSLKGVCLNLGLSELFEKASAVCENVRGVGDNPPVPQQPCGPLLDELTEVYKLTVADINAIEG